MAITFVADARMPATDNANASATSATITPPGGMQANDYVVVHVCSDQIGVTITNTVTGGQTWTAETDFEANSNSLRIFHCRFNGTWDANPAFSWGVSGPYVVWMTVWRGVDQTTAIDAAVSYAGFTAPASPFDMTIAANTITTATDGAMVIAEWGALSDNNELALQTGGWTNPSGQTQWRNAGGTDTVMGIGYKIQTTAGGNEAVTCRQTTLGGDAGVRSIFALRPAAVVQAGIPIPRRDMRIVPLI